MIRWFGFDIRWRFNEDFTKLTSPKNLKNLGYIDRAIPEKKVVAHFSIERTVNEISIN